jgi:UPF0042 nucleotide-binding protein
VGYLAKDSIDPNIVIISGLSGAGKSQALRTLEDLGYFCVDNLPPALMSTFIQLCRQAREPIHKLAMVVDVRGKEFFKDLENAMFALKDAGFVPFVLFLDAEDEVLVRRYKETRRRHPLSSQASILEGIKEERQVLSEIKSKATIVIDTSSLATSELRRHITELFSKTDKIEKIFISVITFGFKHGLPLDADLVFDVRFLPNPYWEPELMAFSGLEPAVSEYVMSSEVAKEFLKRLTNFIDYLIPYFIEEGKTHLTIAIGCTGGRHRSVIIGEKIKDHLETMKHNVIIEHRDIGRGESGGLLK